MPGKYIQRYLVEDGFYHVFNRGNARKVVFREPEDYAFFMKILSMYLQKGDRRQSRWVTKNYAQRIALCAFCLMPNHFHLCLRQYDEHAISEFMHSLKIRYATYFNKKYQSVGHIFQGRYGSRILTNDTDLIHATRYIHANPIVFTSTLSTYPYSSFQYYIGKASPQWLKVEMITKIYQGLFGGQRNATCASYKEFVEEYAKSKELLQVDPSTAEGNANHPDHHPEGDKLSTCGE